MTIIKDEDFNLSEKEKEVIMIMEKDMGLNFNELARKTNISNIELSNILDNLINRGIIAETQADNIVHIESPEKVVIMEIYDKKKNIR